MFPIAAVTNDHKFSGLNNSNLLSNISGGQKFEMSLTGLESRCYQCCGLFLEALRRICSLAFSSFYRLLAFLGSCAFPLSSRPATAHLYDHPPRSSLSLTTAGKDSQLLSLRGISLGPPRSSKVVSLSQGL